MHGMFFMAGVTEPPQSPVFCGYCRKKCAQISIHTSIDKQIKIVYNEEAYFVD
jgi:hypothetical protein